MIKYLLVFSFWSGLNYAQPKDSIFNVFHSHENILRFADKLFCEKDYLRAAEEYLRLPESEMSEVTKYKIAQSYSTIGDYVSSKKYFSEIKETSDYYNLSKLELMKILFLEDNFSGMRKYSDVNKLSNPKLFMISFLKDHESMPNSNDFLKPFNENEKTEAAELYQNKLFPSKKNPLLASLMSAIIPGAGKFYTGEISDGIFALLATGLFAFLAYDNFNADQTFRGWLFSGLAAGFYAGNVYGSYASAQIYNARVSFEFSLRLDSFLRSENYFIPRKDFCE